MSVHYNYGTGRRKSAVARVRVFPGSGQIVINGKPMPELLVGHLALQSVITAPLRVTSALGKFSVMVKVTGGGTSGQAGAISHGLARALTLADENYKPLLRKAGLLTRDPRVKERKKYGLKRARKAPQYTKR
ncbi:MAG: 30S ribosomal protein S9 [Chloroflexi bacterium]|nr:30S ribosomal protein S9 [Chloroflexota bacterium]MCL5109910.1 30S ribosomal protein S9 [Chloroflexota bacterium]